MGLPNEDTRLTRRPFLTFGLAALAAAASAALYLSAGAASAYLAADDFQWLQGGRAFEWSTLWPGGNHFYRPATALWFAGAARLCGDAAGCYHALNIALHAVNVALVFAIVLMLARPKLSRGPVPSAFAKASAGQAFANAFLAAVLFGVLPAYVQAIVWVSAATGLLATLGVLASLACQIRSWRAASAVERRLLEAGAVAAGAVAVFAHEAAATLPFLSWVASRMFAPAPSRWRSLGAGFAVVLLAFAATTILANRENYVFREGHYAPGAHMWTHLLDYLVSLWVGPHVWWAYVLTVLGLAAAALVSPLSRFGVVWMLVTLVPYVGFTWGNVSRYAYLPAVGMAITLAAVGAAAMARRDAGTRSGRRRLASGVLMGLIVARFAVFTVGSARGDVQAFEPVRDYVNHLRSIGAEPVNRVLEVPAPTSEHVDRRYLEVMLRWVYRDPHMTVVVR